MELGLVKCIVGLVEVACDSEIGLAYKGVVMMFCGSSVDSLVENVNLLCSGIVLLVLTCRWDLLEPLGFVTVVFGVFVCVCGATLVD